MERDYFVKPGSIVREIWGDSDTILFIFAGAAAEFALNKAVDWLYFTGKLPSDPLGRLFSTVAYARAIVFSEREEAFRTIDAIASIHSAVEAKRGGKIPDWAYRDVLFMLIDYSIRSYELLNEPMTGAQRQEAFDVFYRVGQRMGLQDLPSDFEEFDLMRKSHMKNDMVRSGFTDDLFRQYRKHLGPFRYKILIECQKLIVPDAVRKLLGFGKTSLLRPMVGIYRLARWAKLDWLVKSAILPKQYKKQISALNVR